MEKSFPYNNKQKGFLDFARNDKSQIIKCLKTTSYLSLFDMKQYKICNWFLSVNILK